jgi:hypothetical protein
MLNYDHSTENFATSALRVCSHFSLYLRNYCAFSDSEYFFLKVVHWKERHHLLAMPAAFVIFLDISFSIVHQRASHLRLAISATNAESQGTLFILAQIMATGNMIPEEAIH